MTGENHQNFRETQTGGDAADFYRVPQCRQTRAVFFTAIAAALVLATSAGSSRAQSAPDVKIIVGEVVASADHTPLFVAAGESIFKKAGLDVELQHMSGGDLPSFAALSNGSVDVLVAGSLDYIQGISKKVMDAKMFGEVVDSSTDLVVTKDITSIDQLKGKVIGVSAFGGGDQLYVSALLAKSGVTKDDVTYAVSGTPATRLAALAAGRIQATAQGNSNRGRSEALGTVLVKSAASPIIVPNIMLGATTSYIATHKDALRKLAMALGQAVAWIRANPEKAVAYCMQGSGADQPTCQTSIATNFDPSLADKHTWSSTFGINVDGIKGALAVAAQGDPAAAQLSVDDVADTSLVPAP